LLTEVPPSIFPALLPPPPARTLQLLLATADSFISTGLDKVGYLYINSDDGWLDLNRTAAGTLHPATTFTNGTLKAVADGLHTKGFKFGIYAAAGQTTCGLRAGTLYHEMADAKQFAAAGIDYLKYDDCGEANIQSYAKYFVMKDALAAAYEAEGKAIDYYSYEPFQVYTSIAVPEMGWTASVGDLWRTGGDIRPMWKSILSNAHANNHWAPNSRPGHYNDADMLEIGNGHLTVAEQRAHFALWCLMKSPLIIGANVSALSTDSLAILKNTGLVAVRCAFSDRNFHSRMPLDPTHVLLKRTCV
jgi:alpha-galactosidase